MVTVNGVDYKHGDEVQIKPSADISSNVHNKLMDHPVYLNHAKKNPGKTVKIRTIFPSEYIETESQTGFNGCYLDFNWVDKVYSTAIPAQKIPALTSANSVSIQMPLASQKPIRYNMGDKVRIKTNLDIKNSYSSYYRQRFDYFNEIKAHEGKIAVSTYEIPVVTTHYDLVLSIDGKTYFADNFWVEPVSNSVSIPEASSVIASKTWSWCNSCGGMNSHRLMCPPSSALRNKTF